jgi:hypothetical protein
MPKGEKLPFPTRTARFRSVVEKCGRPDVHLSLVAPAKDRELKKLSDRCRVMTVWQAHHGGADYGVVGIFDELGVQFLVFDRSLRSFSGRRIVGIDYSLLDAPPEGAKPPPVPGARRPKRAARPAAPPESEPVVEAPAPGWDEIKRELHQIERLLARRHYAETRERVQALAASMQDREPGE